MNTFEEIDNSSEQSIDEYVEEFFAEQTVLTELSTRIIQISTVLEFICQSLVDKGIFTEDEINSLITLSLDKVDSDLQKMLIDEKNGLKSYLREQLRNGITLE